MYLSGKELLICLEMESTEWNWGVLQVLSSWWELKEGQGWARLCSGLHSSLGKQRGENVKGSTWAACLQYVGTPGVSAPHGDKAVPTQNPSLPSGPPEALQCPRDVWRAPNLFGNCRSLSVLCEDAPSSCSSSLFLPTPWTNTGKRETEKHAGFPYQSVGTVVQIDIN